MYCHIFYSISSVVLQIWFVDLEHRITWKLIRNAISQAPAQSYCIRNSDHEAQNSAFRSPPGDSDAS